MRIGSRILTFPFNPYGGSPFVPSLWRGKSLDEKGIVVRGGLDRSLQVDVLEV